MTPHVPPAPARAPLLPLLVLTLAAAALRLPWLARDGLWFDEVFSVVLAAQEVPELVRRALADQTNPPGFYLLLRGWLLLGGLADAWLRLLPAICGILTPAAVALLTLRLGGLLQTALLAGTIAAASPLLLAMSVEVRAYAPMALLATVGLLLALRLAGDAASAPGATGSAPQRPLAALVAANAGLVALHYFGALAIAAQAAVLLAAPAGAPRRSLARRLALAAAPAALLLTAWLAAVVTLAPTDRLAPNVDWITPAGLADLPRFAGQLIGTLGTAWGTPAIAALVATALVLALAARGGTGGGSRQGARLAALAALVPVALVLAGDALTARALWVPRYLVAAVPPLAVAIALATERLPAYARDLVASTLSAWALVAGMHELRARPPRPDWARIAAELSRGTPTILCVNEPYVGLPFEYHALRDSLPVRVLDMRACEPGSGRSWAVYRVGTESSLGAVVARGARLGPRLVLGTAYPPTEARALDWPRR